MRNLRRVLTLMDNKSLLSNSDPDAQAVKAKRAAKEIKDSIRKRKGTCALFLLPSGKRLICKVSEQAYQQAVHSYSDCWIGTYTPETAASLIAEDLVE